MTSRLSERAALSAMLVATLLSLFVVPVFYVVMKQWLRR